MRAKYSVAAFINIQYDKMQNRCAGYGHQRYKGKELCSRKEFTEWAIDSGALYSLYHDWNRQGHELKYRPTVDRIDNARGYSLDNIRWISHRQNTILGNLKRRR